MTSSSSSTAFRDLLRDIPTISATRSLWKCQRAASRRKPRTAITPSMRSISSAKPSTAWFLSGSVPRRTSPRTSTTSSIRKSSWRWRSLSAQSSPPSRELSHTRLCSISRPQLPTTTTPRSTRRVCSFIQAAFSLQTTARSSCPSTSAL